MPSIPSTSVRLHSEFLQLLFLQDHRETDRFFTVSGVLSVQSDRGFFHYRRVPFSVQFKRKVGQPLATVTALRITLNLMGYSSLQEHILTHHTRKHLVY
jgi:hypothetical protein